MLTSTQGLRSRAGVLVVVVAAGAASSVRADDPSIESALQRVNAQCPATYPATVTQIPETSEFDRLTTPELVKLLANWSPAMRQDAARVLATRDDVDLAAMVEAARSGDDNLRAGAAVVLAERVRDELRDWQTVLPDAKDARTAQATIRQRHASLVPLFIDLTKDPQMAVRSAALVGLAQLEPDTPAAKEAVLALCFDPDAYISAGAINTFRKSFTAKSVDREKLVAALKQSMRAPLPNARGSAVTVILTLDRDTQRQFVPLLLDLLDWQPDRDTMFGAAGQAESLKLLTEMGVKDVLPRITKLMDKTMRGPGLFEPCLESIRTFGKDAQAILPDLKAYEAGLAEKVKAAPERERAPLEMKLKKLRETMNHVETL